ncbi:uncharacterized protein BO96DRAFT_409548 [Aspergillus niger CBS 101883]|uniref:uncharacterized protein n=1 Tax=Aspergillus lacticoffeatus (strain CBS 101883) TaxID=1450533 RepID=UPI000D8047CC|nr:uncharacterized protein BO96DRAFT_409548 [Aspergillus niger CBS 101883]PYH59243.1 hypothetical protein BO96DRAFT_409548 [Aspergillus niger CBS 101883]
MAVIATADQALHMITQYDCRLTSQQTQQAITNPADPCHFVLGTTAVMGLGAYLKAPGSAQPGKLHR